MLILLFRVFSVFRGSSPRLCVSAVVLVVLSVTAHAAEDVFPPELVRFEAVAEKPVFTAAGEGKWDAKLRERGWILRDGDTWRMWYTGYDGTREGRKRLGHATSPDGLAWTRDPRNPLLSETYIEDMQVLRDDDTYYLFAEGIGPSGQADQAQWFTSPDGIAWKRQGTLDIRRVDGSPIAAGPFGTPAVFREKDRWYLLYERGDQGVWLATSENLKTWTNVQDAPVLTLGPADYDKTMIAVNQLIKHNGKYYAYYHGSGTQLPPRTWNTCVAVSEDLKHWKKYSGNPIVSGDRSSGIVVPLDKVHGQQCFRLYTMHGQVEAFESAAEK